ncbi:hypothetical protein TrispH2_002909 [Trichoplax sp. H2]|nr:hypothetical protein TrispH2_002909 [Trichoplax sp. H2]|eukprot:RDD44715.1 hypothetical protein TrispH2_002909 [Trichoplax sp. H2]
MYVYAAFRSYRVRKKLQHVRRELEDITTDLDSGYVAITWTKSNLPCNPLFHSKKSTDSSKLLPVTNSHDDSNLTNKLSTIDNDITDDLEEENDLLNIYVNSKVKGEKENNDTLLSEGSSPGSSPDDANSEKLKDFDVIPEADSTTKTSILIKESSSNNASSESDTKLESVTLSNIKEKEHKDGDNNDETMTTNILYTESKERGELTPETSLDSANDEEPKEDDVANNNNNNGNKEILSNTESQISSDCHPCDNSIPKGRNEDDAPQAMEDQDRIPNVENEKAYSNDANHNRNVVNNPDLESNDPIINPNNDFKVPTPTLVPTQDNKINIASINDSWDMIGNMSYINRRENVEYDKYPKDMNSLLKLRRELATELLWIEQAIFSRKNCLKIKARCRNDEIFPE